MSDWIGRTVSKVEIQKLLGRGGMAEVYLGRHTTLNREVAVKVLQAHLLEDSDFAQRFRNEAQAVAAMRHPNIVQVHDFDVVDERPYMVMELLEGPTLKDYLAALRERGETLPPSILIRLISSLAAALDYAHERGIVHRDIKPANILLRSARGQIDPAAPLPSDVEPVLTDFGVARIANTALQTASGKIIGTPAYMSPEQVQGKIVDARSDIYALGIVLYEMLTNRLPFDADTQAAILIQHLNEPVPPLPQELARLQSVIDHALSKDPATRFQKASDLALALKGASEGRDVLPGVLSDASTVNLSTPLSAKADTPVGTSTTPISVGGINPIWVAAGIGALALIVGIVALGLALGGGRQTVLPLATSPGSDVAGVATEDGETIAQENTPEPTAEVPETPSGAVVFQDATLHVALVGLPIPSEGMVYEAWLTDPDADPLSLGVVEVTDGKGLVDYADPDGGNLLGQYSGFALSEELLPDPEPDEPDEFVYMADIAPETIQSLRAVLDASPDVDLKTALMDGLISESDHYDSHLGFAIDALNAGDLAGAKTHSEHIINIAVGEQGEEYADWNGNDRIENPGNGVGFRTYLLALEAVASSAASNPDATEEMIRKADEISTSSGVLLDIVDDAVGLAAQVATADTIDVLEDMSDSMQGVIVDMAFHTLILQVEDLDPVFAVKIVPVEE